MARTTQRTALNRREFVSCSESTANLKKLKRKRAHQIYSEQEQLISKRQRFTKQFSGQISSDVLKSALFPFLEGSEIAKYSRVCKEWYQLILDDEVWRRVVIRTFGYQPLQKDVDALQAPSRKWFNYYYTRYMDTRGVYIAKLANYGLKLKDVTSTLDPGCDYLVVKETVLKDEKPNLKALGSLSHLGIKASQLSHARIFGEKDIQRGVYIEQWSQPLQLADDVIYVDCLNSIVCRGTTILEHLGTEPFDMSIAESNVHCFKKIQEPFMLYSASDTFILEITDQDKFEESLNRAPPKGLVFQGGADASFAIGESKAGTSPDLPADYPWPVDPVDGKPLDFVAQLNVLDMKMADIGDYLPSDGMIWLFAPPSKTAESEKVIEDSVKQPRHVIYMSNKQIKSLGGLVRKRVNGFCDYQLHTGVYPAKLSFYAPILPAYMYLPDYVQGFITKEEYENEIWCPRTKPNSKMFGQLDLEDDFSLSDFHKERNSRVLSYPKQNGKGSYRRIPIVTTVPPVSLSTIVMQALQLKSGVVDPSKIYLQVQLRGIETEDRKNLHFLGQTLVTECDESTNLKNITSATFAQIPQQLNMPRNRDRYLFYELDDDNDCTPRPEEDTYPYFSNYTLLFSSGRYRDAGSMTLKFFLPLHAVEQKTFIGGVVIA